MLRKQNFQKFSIHFNSHWLELGFMNSPKCEGVWKIQHLAGLSAALNKINILFVRRHGIIGVFPGSSTVKNPPTMQETGLIPGLGRSPGGGHRNPLQYSCLENPTDGGAWQATVHRLAKSRIRLSYFTFTFIRHRSRFWDGGFFSYFPSRSLQTSATLQS